MTLYAKLENDIVIQVIETTDIPLKDLYHPDFIKTCVECSSDVVAGYKYVNGKFKEPDPALVVEPPLKELSLKQLILKLHALQLVTEDEVDNWLTKTGLPELFNKVLSYMSIEQRIEAKVVLFTATYIERSNQIIKVLIENSEDILGKKITDKEVNDFWIEALSK